MIIIKSSSSLCFNVQQRAFKYTYEKGREKGENHIRDDKKREWKSNLTKSLCKLFWILKLFMQRRDFDFHSLSYLKAYGEDWVCSESFGSSLLDVFVSNKVEINNLKGQRYLSYD